jgi:pyruvate/2-oxoglutarate dehydrogenase complex dihydrolipoamide acyltransferase (E2) component
MHQVDKDRATRRSPTFSCNDRIVDGREAVMFLVRVKESLEDPGRLVLDL